MKRILGVALSGLLASSAFAAGLSEIRIDQPGTDLDEYFEISGTPGESLTGLTYIVIGDDGGDGSGSNGKRSGAIEAVISLDGLSIPADGFFLAAEGSFGDPGGLGLSGSVDLTTDLNFENSDNVSHLLVMGFTGADGDVLDTDRDGTLDITPWTSVVDGISLVETVNPPDSNTNEWNYGFGGGIGPAGDFVPGHIFRDDAGAWQIGNFGGGDDTPGVPEPASLMLLALGAVALRRR